VHGGQPLLQNDPHWRDLLLFYEYFHGDNGAGIGASHQTGWSGLVAVLPRLFRTVTAESVRKDATGVPGQRAAAEPAATAKAAAKASPAGAGTGKAAAGARRSR
jgi:hypothetical protein